MNLFFIDMANKHVDFLSDEDKKKWLMQRGWQLQGLSWRDPDNSMPFFFQVALERAKSQCRVPADFELRQQ